MAINKAQAHIGTQDYKTDATIRNFSMTLDEDVASGGQDLGPNPSELLAASLSACTAITLRMYAARKQWPLAAVQVDVAINWRAQPASIVRKIKIEGDLNEEQRTRLMQIANACPVHKLLEGAQHVETTAA
jgi:putative redox protein